MTNSRSPEAPAEVRPFQEVLYRWPLLTPAEREARRKAWAEAYDKMTSEQRETLNERFKTLALP